MASIKNISETYISQIERKISVTSPTSPLLAGFQAELEEARLHLAAKNRVIEAARRLGYIRNKFAGRCALTGQEVKPFAGFARKDDLGAWKTYSFEVVCDAVGITTV